MPFDRLDIETEIRLAVEAKLQNPLGSCFAYNPAIPALKRHGPQLLAVIEHVLPMIKRPNHISARLFRTNLISLFDLYFRMAEHHESDEVTLLERLDDATFAAAASAIDNVWGTNNDMRRTVIPEKLFDLLKSRLPDGNHLIVALTRYFRTGQLTFDPLQPGARIIFPPRPLSAETAALMARLQTKIAAES